MLVGRTGNHWSHPYVCAVPGSLLLSLTARLWGADEKGVLGELSDPSRRLDGNFHRGGVPRGTNLAQGRRLVEKR
jgi:hypothetical protein